MPARKETEDRAKADRARYDREMETNIPPNGETEKKSKDPNALLQPSSCFVLSVAPE